MNSLPARHFICYVAYAPVCVTLSPYKLVKINYYYKEFITHAYIYVNIL